MDPRVSSIAMSAVVVSAGLFLPASKFVMAADEAMDSQIMRYEDRVIDPRDWGAFARYFGGDTRANGAVRVSKGTINPGDWPHPPHRHDAEEIIHVVSGEGTWYLNDEVLPARAGDMVFIASQDLHTLKNTGMEPVEFLVIFLAGPGKD